MLVSEKVEKLFFNLLQHNICISYNNKNIKTGKLLLVSHKSTNICLTLLQKDLNTKTYELPYPFEYRLTEPGEVIFDYCLSAICPTSELVSRFEINVSKKSKKSHRFLNNHVTIKIID